MPHHPAHRAFDSIRKPFAPSPEHRWISDGSTLNPSPGPLLQERRDTAEGCRDRATADLLESIAMTTIYARQKYKRSAASWIARAKILEQAGSRIESRRSAPQLTPDEIAEDAAFLRA